MNLFVQEVYAPTETGLKFNYQRTNINFTTMKRIIVLALAIMTMWSAQAQETKPERIPWFVERGETPEWYAAQIEAWEKVVAREPKNEEAWSHLSRATRYKLMLGDGDWQPLHDLNERMAKAIPDTYTYHFSARFDQDETQAENHLERAYQLMPSDRNLGEEFGSFIAYFWRKGKWKELEEVSRRYYADRSVPTSLLRYNYNELQCLPENAIYFGNGDPILLPKMAIQYGMKVHQDKMVICASFLCVESYYKMVCKQLGIVPEKFDIADYQTETGWKKYLLERIRYIIQQSGRPSYFSPSSLSDGSGLKALKENLYNEGLVLRYSEEPYDNYARVRENLERNIRLDYLLEPEFIIEPEWESANSLTFNYFILLSPLIKKYKEWNNPERSEWLKNLLTTALKQSKMEGILKKECQEYLKKYSNE